MKQFIILVATLVLGSSCFAQTQSMGLSKDSARMKALNSAWNFHPSVTPKPDQRDLTMVYGGEDISRRPTLVEHTASA